MIAPAMAAKQHVLYWPLQFAHNFKTKCSLHGQYGAFISLGEPAFFSFIHHYQINMYLAKTHYDYMNI